MIIVIDTSALMRLYIPDGPLPEGIEAAMRSAERAEARIIAPELILAEAAQVLHKKRTQRILSSDECIGILEHLLLLPVQYMPHASLVVRACTLAHETRLTVYDALFLALAERNNARVITADEALRAAARSMNLI